MFDFSIFCPVDNVVHVSFNSDKRASNDVTIACARHKLGDPAKGYIKEYVDQITENPAVITAHDMDVLLNMALEPAKQYHEFDRRNIHRRNNAATAFNAYMLCARHHLGYVSEDHIKKMLSAYVSQTDTIFNIGLLASVKVLIRMGCRVQDDTKEMFDRARKAR